MAQFCSAIERYNKKRIYARIEWTASVLILFLQALTLVSLIKNYEGTQFIFIGMAFTAAYVLTDFINGFTHMFMDNNTHYKSVVGPFIAAFHLHHFKLKYTERTWFNIYFYESGTKFWLLVYLLVFAWTQYYFSLSFSINVCLASIGILSSVAELSHYWCHNATEKNTIIRRLQNYQILLSKQHHLNHHRSDNTHYAFLNGLTDPLLNLISHYLYHGYKNHADLHVKAYKRSATSN